MYFVILAIFALVKCTGLQVNEVQLTIIQAYSTQVVY
jgi:hypothetical protein